MPKAGNLHSDQMTGLKKKLEHIGHLFFYIALKIFGLRGAYLFLYPVVFSYVLCSGHIRETTSHYLARRFPNRNGMGLFFDTFRNIFFFGQTLIDRAWIGLCQNADMKGEVVGQEKLLEAIERGKGAVLITAHVGNWQTALSKLDFIPVKVHALMQYDQLAAAKHFFDLGKKEKTFDIIDIDGPFGGMIDATAALQRGEVVTIMSDRHVKGSTKAVEFLGEEVRLPDAAYSLAACVEAPVIIFLAAKTGIKDFKLHVRDIFFPEFVDRDDRDKLLEECCQKFAYALEKHLHEYPYQWYNFYNIWSQAKNGDSDKSI